MVNFISVTIDNDAPGDVYGQCCKLDVSKQNSLMMQAFTSSANAADRFHAALGMRRAC